MTQQDAETIIAIASLAAQADGRRDAQEQSQLDAVAKTLGVAVGGSVATAGDVTVLAARLSPDAREAAYETAVAVCHADGAIDPREVAFLQALADALAVDATSVNSAAGAAGTMASAALADSAPSASAPASMSGAQAGLLGPALDTHILDQAILTAALELLPDRLANIGILPLQLRLVREIGRRHGLELDAAQIKDLAATFGVGAAAQLMESVVRKTLGGLAGGLLGGMFGGAAGLAAGGAVTFASTYALGHAAARYYAQGRTLSTADLKALFTRFQAEAETLFPRVQERVRTMASGNSLETLMRTVRG